MLAAELERLRPGARVEETDRKSRRIRHLTSISQQPPQGQLAKETAAVVAACGNAADPGAYGRAVASKILPNVLPYTIGVTTGLEPSRVHPGA
jgi:hypothetical protein